MKKYVVVLMLIFPLLVFALKTENTCKSKVLEESYAEKIISVLVPFLQGESNSDIKSKFSPEAYVIYDNNYESIFEVLTNSSKRERFLVGRDIHTGFIYLRINEVKDLAYLVFETKSNENTKSNWHSLLIKINENDKWQILSWHKS